MVSTTEARHDGTVADELVRVCVVDDQATFRRATAAALDAMDDFVLAGECETGEAAVEFARGSDTNLFLMDIHMPGIGGIEAARRLHVEHPELTVILMSTYDLEDLPAAAADCGAAAYLHKERLCPELLSRIWRAGG